MEPDIPRLVAQLATRTDAQANALLRRLQRRAWPAGPADRRDPCAVEWLRRWAPARLAAAPPPGCPN